ncbi:MAG: branched-chain amino acid transport system II carrier protein, partial [Bacteroidota bacterium]|nr:branched-chain amino acid transport system II carrier protein [Bacteroidota bacterium]
MRFNKEVLVTGFAIFSLFFGAGNLILPPYLGYLSGTHWLLVTLGFFISAVFIPILGVIAHARLQGTMLDFATKIHPVFSTVFCILVYLVSVTLPGPRTASVTYEMAIEPYFEINSLTSSAIYFGLVLLSALNRSKLLDLLGKYLTPLLLLILVTIIAILCLAEIPIANDKHITNVVSTGILEGYQTYDAIGAIVIGALAIISLKIKFKESSVTEKRKVLFKAAFIAGIGLLLIYTGLIYAGSLFSNLTEEPSRTDLLTLLSYEALGSSGNIVLSILVALACFTTAVGVVTGTADFFQVLNRSNKTIYPLMVTLACIAGIIIGQTGVSYIITIGVPILAFIYPLVITLILLNA